MTSPNRPKRRDIRPQCRRRGKCFQTSTWCTARKENNYSIHWLHVNQYPQSNVAISQAYPSFSTHQSLPIPWCVNWKQTDSNRKESPLGDPVRNLLPAAQFLGCVCVMLSGHLAIAPIQDSISIGVYWSIYPSTSLKNSAENLWRFLFNDSVWSISDVHCPTLMLLYFISFGSLIPFNSGVKFQEGEPFHQKWDETCLTLSHHLWWCWFIHHLWLYSNATELWDTLWHLPLHFIQIVIANLRYPASVSLLYPHFDQTIWPFHRTHQQLVHMFTMNTFPFCSSVFFPNHSPW